MKPSSISPTSAVLGLIGGGRGAGGSEIVDGVPGGSGEGSGGERGELCVCDWGSGWKRSLILFGARNAGCWVELLR